MQYLIREKNRAKFHALTLTLLPINVFFSFLYYTDAGSMFFVLLMNFFALKESSKVSKQTRHYKPQSIIRSSWKSAAVRYLN